MEMRIIDANKFRNAWNPDGVIGQTMMRLIDEQPTIDPETLPIVQELREQLERVTRERDALLKEFAGDCGMCLHYEDCAKKRTSCGGADWEWYGLQKEVQDDG